MRMVSKKPFRTSVFSSILVAGGGGAPIRRLHPVQSLFPSSIHSSLVIPGQVDVEPRAVLVSGGCRWLEWCIQWSYPYGQGGYPPFHGHCQPPNSHPTALHWSETKASATKAKQKRGRRKLNAQCTLFLRKPVRASKVVKI